MKNILLLCDYRGFFATKFIGTQDNHVGTTMDVGKIASLFEANQFFVEIKKMSEVDFSKDYTGWYVLYASSEEAGLFYKEYIEDILLGLIDGGATILPSFKFFRTHSNKSFQEILRKQFTDPDLQSPSAYSLGEYSEVERLKDKINFPAVVKVANGAGSKGVRLAYSQGDLMKIAKKLMTHKYYDFESNLVRRCGLFIKRFLRRVTGKRVKNEPLFMRLRTNKIIIEEYVPNLSGDNKVLYFGGKYFVLRRKNRDHDFRASGSGKFSYPKESEEIKNVLTLAEKVVKEFDMPIMSLDIGENEKGTYLLEFQCVYFGPYTLQYAPFCFEKTGEKWVKIAGPFDLEEEYVRSITEYINRYE